MIYTLMDANAHANSNSTNAFTLPSSSGSNTTASTRGDSNSIMFMLKIISSRKEKEMQKAANLQPTCMKILFRHIISNEQQEQEQERRIQRLFRARIVYQTTTAAGTTTTTTSSSSTLSLSSLSCRYRDNDENERK